MAAQIRPDLNNISQLTDEEYKRYESDDQFKILVNSTISKNKAKALPSGTSPGTTGLLEESKRDPPKLNKLRQMRSTKYPAAKSQILLEAMYKVSANKVREMSQADVEAKFEDFCDKNNVPADEGQRQALYFSLLLWITLNTASTENGQDSTFGDGYSSRALLEFFDFDLRPFARACAKDAKILIETIALDKDHEAHDQIMDLARKYEVPKTPWLIYDGIEAAGLPMSENRMARAIKQQRLDTNVNPNLDATINRNLLRGNDRRIRPDN